MPYSNQIIDMMTTFYTHYYRDELGLPDWQNYVKSRYTEEKNILPIIEQVEDLCGKPFSQGMKILVLGGGTGAEFLALSTRGCDTYAIEPDKIAVTVGTLKAKENGINPSKFIQGVGEQLPFHNSAFDLVWCWTVLEHVSDVKTCIHEMVRVTKPLGNIFIGTPDYHQFFEAHYKLFMPMIAPKWVLRLWLKILGRPVLFLSRLNLLMTRTFLTRIFQELPVFSYFVVLPWSDNFITARSWKWRTVKWITRVFGIHHFQYWILKKIH